MVAVAALGHALCARISGGDAVVERSPLGGADDDIGKGIAAGCPVAHRKSECALDGAQAPELESRLAVEDQAVHGVRGIVNEDLVNLTRETAQNLELLGLTPSAALGSTRDKPDLAYC